MKRLLGMGAVLVMALGVFTFQLTAGGEVLRQAGRLVTSGEVSVLAGAGGTAITAMASAGARHASALVADGVVTLALRAVHSPALSGLVAFHDAPKSTWLAVSVPAAPAVPRAFDMHWNGERVPAAPVVVVDAEKLRQRLERMRVETDRLRRVMVIRSST